MLRLTAGPWRVSLSADVLPAKYLQVEVCTKEPSDTPKTMTEDSFSLAERILLSIRRIIRATDLQGRELARQFGVTAPQLVCLRYLSSRGLMNAGELARGVSLSQGTITGILDRLERGGLVTRRRSSVDRRCVLVELTPRGRELAATVPTPLHERFSDRLTRLKEEDQLRIEKALGDVVHMLEARELDAAPVLASDSNLGVPGSASTDPAASSPISSQDSAGAGLRAIEGGGGES